MFYCCPKGVYMNNYNQRSQNTGRPVAQRPFVSQSPVANKMYNAALLARPSASNSSCTGNSCNDNSVCKNNIIHNSSCDSSSYANPSRPNNSVRCNSCDINSRSNSSCSDNSARCNSCDINSRSNSPCSDNSPSSANNICARSENNNQNASISGTCRGGCGSPDKHTDAKLAGLPKAMAYVPYTCYEDMYCSSEGFNRGTIFKQLDFDFKGRRC